LAGNGYPHVREALDEISALRERVAFMAGDAQDMRAENERLRELLYEVWDAAPYLGSDINWRVREALGDE
jgi:regulator of replication initiation timing